MTPIAYHIRNGTAISNGIYSKAIEENILYEQRQEIGIMLEWFL